MKLFLLSILCFLSLNLLQAQLTIEPAQIKKQISIELDNVAYEEILKVRVSNPTDRTLSLRWDKNVIYQPNVWESQICDKEASYPPFVKTNYDPMQNINAPIRLKPHEGFDLYLTLLPYNTTGNCRIEIPFYELSGSNKPLATAVFQVNLITTKDQQAQAAATTKGKRRGVKIYPNPVYDRFFLSNTPADLDKVEVFNTLGHKVKIFDQPVEGQDFEVKNLPQGVYLVSLVNTEGKVIRTLRLLIREFRP